MSVEAIGMMGKLGIVLAVSLVLVLTLMATSYASTTPCSDSTAYYACSQTLPGYACVPDTNSGTNTLQSVVGNKASSFTKCQCANFPGYVEQNSECVKTSCTDNGAQLNNSACAFAKPKQCANGQLVDNAAFCGCPDGQQAKADGKLCEPKVGCRWSTPACPPDKECKYVASDNTDNGACTAKKGCAFGTVTCTSSQNCDTSKNASGECVTKPGCQYLNPACAKGQTCNAVSGVCEDSTAVGGGAIALPGASGTSKPSVGSAPTANALGGLSCCCAPAAGGAAMVGLAFYKRRKAGDPPEDEEE